MSDRLLRSPRLRVSMALAVLVFLVGLLAVRPLLSTETGPHGVAAPPNQMLSSGVSKPVDPKPIVPNELVMPCWSCPGAEDTQLHFRTDLDLLAPLGTGERNAGEWFAAFTGEVGSRASEVSEIMNRRVDSDLGRILPANDPLLREAEPWLDQAVMRFYPDIYPMEGFQTRIPNLMLALTIARSFVARGQGTASFDEALIDFRRAIRLGRLLRQDDAVLINDLVGLAAIRTGVDAIYDRARRAGRLDLALAAAVIDGEAPAQKLLSGARMTKAEVLPYLHRDSSGTTITIAPARFDSIRTLATSCPDRRFRLEAAASVSLVASFGTGTQQAEARDILRQLAGSTDPLVASNARWHLENPVRADQLEQLLAHDQ